MAARNSTEKKREAIYHREIEGAVAEERRRLMQARAVLECMVFTLNNTANAAPEECDLDAGDYADVAVLVRDLIAQAITALDSVSIIRRPSHS